MDNTKTLYFYIYIFTYKIVPITSYCFFPFYPLSLIQFSQYFPSYFSFLVIQRFSSIFRRKYNMTLQFHFLCHKLCISTIPLSLRLQRRNPFWNHSSNMCFSLCKKKIAQFSNLFSFLFRYHNNTTAPIINITESSWDTAKFPIISWSVLSPSIHTLPQAYPKI